ncbi:hypothetical protein BDN71DRAFT_330393 [Pleurotus eryngii]|uniref:Transmembrane protein n=1 Tax=Pleurotus eryngii TaxID=5323 RepID=A0A9P5ZKZ9_PLEER|nr:hypothetical protein BDN71DRAFT_330393 [Pleurotus eryngii]
MQRVESDVYKRKRLLGAYPVPLVPFRIISFRPFRLQPPALAAVFVPVPSSFEPLRSRVRFASCMGWCSPFRFASHFASRFNFRGHLPSSRLAPLVSFLLSSSFRPFQKIPVSRSLRRADFPHSSHSQTTSDLRLRVRVLCRPMLWGSSSFWLYAFVLGAGAVWFVLGIRGSWGTRGRSRRSWSCRDHGYVVCRGRRWAAARSSHGTFHDTPARRPLSSPFSIRSLISLFSFQRPTRRLHSTRTKACLERAQSALTFSIDAGTTEARDGHVPSLAQ